MLPIDKKLGLEKTIEYFNGDELSATVWQNKYALKDGTNIYETTPDDMHWRIANEISRIDQKYPNPQSPEFYFNLMKDFKYIIPQGSPMSGIGNTLQTVSLSNCFVVGNTTSSDSYGGILKIDQELVQLMKRRGGVGTDLSHIRPKGSPVKNSAISSTGVVPFMERYSNSTREVAQDGRRGALMLSIHISHLDTEDFIDAKMEAGKVTGANISVKLTDEFMEVVERTHKSDVLDYRNLIKNKSNPERLKELQDKILYEQSFEFPDGSKMTKRVVAKDLWDKLMFNAWKSAEPGVMFWDKMISESLAEHYKDFGFANVGTNPCGEIVLCPDDSCRLICINLYSYVKNPFSKTPEFDFELFKQHSSYITRMMDNIIDLELEKIDGIINKIENDPEPIEIKQNELDLWKRIKYKCETGRRTGIGVTAEGDMIAAMGLRYGTKEATEFATEIHKVYATEVYKEGVNLAKDRGSFPIFDWELEKNNPFTQRIMENEPDLLQDLIKYGRRNIALLTIAPTGTVSLLSQTTSGVEPAFMVYYTRRRKINPNDKGAKVDFIDELGDCWEEYNVFHHKFVDWYMINNPSETLQTWNEYLKYLEKLPKSEVDVLIEQSPYYKAMANDVDWVEKVRMQGEIQKWIDHSISVTCNLPNTVDVDLVSDVYMTGWKSGCKGVTIYRDGSRSGVLVNEPKEEESKSDITDSFFREHHAPKRPKKLDCDVVRFSNKGSKWVAFIGTFHERPYEIFTGADIFDKLPQNIEKGFLTKTKIEGVSKYHFSYKDKEGIEVKLDHNLKESFDPIFYDTAKMVSAIMRHGMPIPYIIDLLDGLNLDGDLIVTWKSGVKRILKRYLKDTDTLKGQKCPSCGSEQLMMIEGCLTCKECGNSKCG